MNQLRYLIDCQVQKATKTKQPNGTIISSYTDVKKYKIQLQELVDQISASIYGADVNRMYRINSPRNDLEKFLFSKVNNSSDNISYYVLVIQDKRYKITTVRQHWADIELI